MLESISLDMPMPELDALLGLDAGAAVEQLLVGAGPVGQADLLPQALAVVARVGGPPVAEPEVLVGRGVERAAGAEPHLLAEALHRLVLEVGQVAHALLQRRRREDELDQVVALAGGDLGRGPGQELGLVDVVDAHVDAHLRAPVLGEGVEPGVVAGHEVAPLEDLQVARQLGGGLDEGGRDVGDDRRRGAGGGAVLATGGQHGEAGCALDEPTSGDAAVQAVVHYFLLGVRAPGSGGLRCEGAPATVTRCPADEKDSVTTRAVPRRCRPPARRGRGRACPGPC